MRRIGLDRRLPVGGLRRWRTRRRFAPLVAGALFWPCQGGGPRRWHGCLAGCGPAAQNKRGGQFHREHVNHSMRVDFADLREADNRPPLIDARDAPRYAGTGERIEPRRLATFPVQSICPTRSHSARTGLLLDVEAQRDRWRGSKNPAISYPVVYCGSGHHCLRRTCCRWNWLGVKGARMYPGSWSDWCQQGGEVATGEQ